MQASTISSTDVAGSPRPALLGVLGWVLIVAGAVVVPGNTRSLIRNLGAEGWAATDARAAGIVLASGVILIVIGWGLLTARRWAAILFICLGALLLLRETVRAWASLQERYGDPIRGLNESNLGWLWVLVMLNVVVFYGLSIALLLHSRTRAWFRGRERRRRAASAAP